MAHIQHNLSSAQKRKIRIRKKIHGTTKRPRVTVFRSNQHTYLQAIDDDKGVTIAAANEQEYKDLKGTKSERAVALAEELASQLKAKKITQIVFDRGAYRYHGRVKAAAEALRSAGIEF